jgi:hypothetical protein
MLPPVVKKAASLQASSSEVIFPSKRTTCLAKTTCHYSKKKFYVLLGGIIPLCILTNQGCIYYPINKIYINLVCLVFIRYITFLLSTSGVSWQGTGTESNKR